MYLPRPYLQYDVAHIQCRGNIKSTVLIRCLESVNGLTYVACAVYFSKKIRSALFERDAPAAELIYVSSTVRPPLNSSASLRERFLNSRASSFSDRALGVTTERFCVMLAPGTLPCPDKLYNSNQSLWVPHFAYPLKQHSLHPQIPHRCLAHVAAKSANRAEGDLIPKKFLIFDTTLPKNPDILFHNQAPASEIPFHNP